MPNCPLCQTGLEITLPVEGRDAQYVACPVCGNYIIDALAPIRPESRYILSAMTRQVSDAGGRRDLTTESVPGLIESAPVPKTPLEALDRLLLFIRARTTSFTGPVPVRPPDYPLLFARNGDELVYLLNQLIEQGLLDSPSDRHYRLTLAGWERSNSLLAATPKSAQAFVAMWFTDDTEAAWNEGFRPALIDAGYDPVRVDLVEHNGKICDRIVGEIRLSGLLVADFTGNRGGVYFESGFAMGLGLPVVWTCRATDVDQLHFDTRQYNHVVWDAPADLRTKLTHRVRATAPRAR